MTYPDRFYVEGQDASNHRFLYGYGDFSVNLLGLPSSGTFNAFEEYDVNTAGTRWYLDGVSISASSVTSAATGGSIASLIQGAFSGNDTITLSPFDDVMNGYGGNDSMKGGGGNDTMDGGSGSDTALFDGSFASATISFDGSVLVVSTPADGMDRLSNFEFVDFNGDVRSVASLNDPPVPSAKTDTATEDGAVVMGQLSATDPDSSSLTFSAAAPAVAGLTINADGSYSFNPSNAAYQSLSQGEMVDLVANFNVSDGYNTAGSTLTITITGVNDAPVISASGLNIQTTADTAKDFSVIATDAEGDTLTYMAADPAHGSVTGGAGGQFTYTPDGGYVGMDSIEVTVSDGNGGSTMQTYDVTVAEPNQPPVASPTTDTAIEDGPIVTGQLVATDPDGDDLTFSPVLTGQFAPGVAGLSINPDGSYSFDPSNAEYQSLAQGEMVDLLAGYFVSDGDLTDSSTLTITITGVNDAPVFQPSVLELAATIDTPKNFTATATDVDGDALTYSAGDPAHGTVTGGAGGQFTYTPDSGFMGVDSITVTASDGKGGSAMLSYVVTVSEGSGGMPAPDDWTLLTKHGFVGEIGGSGSVFGTTSHQDITVLDEPGTVALDASFNRGDDIVRLTGDANDWQVMQSGSQAVFSDGDTFVEIPFGTAGLAVVFGDGVRELRYDTGEGSAKIGAQSFGTEFAQITAPTDGTAQPGGADPAAGGLLLLKPGTDVTAGGVLEIFGTVSGETVQLLSGNATFDASFNKGGDVLMLDAPATDFMANREGSAVFLDSADYDVLIPIGTAGLTLEFAGSDDRTLIYDTGLGTILIGSQQIGFDPVALIA